MAYTALSLSLQAEPLRSVAFGAIGAAYIGIGTSLSNAARIIQLQNLTDVTLLFSLDGVTDNFRIPTNGYLLLDIAANRTQAQGWYLAEGQRFYVKQDAGGAPTIGTVDLAVFYGGGA
jgi:hypothetical protein